MIFFKKFIHKSALNYLKGIVERNSLLIMDLKITPFRKLYPIFMIK